MKTLRHIFGTGIVIAAILMTGSKSFGQTDLNFTAITPTVESAMQMTWTSVSNEVYQIQYADTLYDTNTGLVTWNTLYDNYPSQGTNTFWLDTGNYNVSPAILHPKYMPSRFYRIVDIGPDTTSDEPVVSISSPTNGTLASGELTLTVTGYTDQPVLTGTKLYVDGQEMPVADSSTNYSIGTTNYETDTYNINTCEWPNGTHTLFATVECQSAFGDVLGASSVATGHGVSPFVQATFNNLVTRIAFSQPSFDPSSGQTQQVTAVFPLDSDWTLHIVDVFSNVVQTATGSGMSMLYNWNGTSGGTNFPAGLYFYYISAQTNGETPESLGGGSGGSSGGGGVPSPDAVSVSSLNGVSSSSDTETVSLPLPPGMSAQDENGNNISTVTIPRPHRHRRSSRTSATSANATLSSSFSPDDIGGPGYVTPLPSPQSAPVAPQRPPTNPIRGIAGTFGIAYDTYSANGSNGFVVGPLLDGSGAGTHISFQGHSASSSQQFKPLPGYKSEADSFISGIQHWGWKSSFVKANDQLQIGDLRGSGSPFNSVNIGVLLTHAVYGTSPDYAANQCKQMYFPISSGGSAQYLRMSEMNWGGSGTNGLKWMVVHACHSLYHTDWSSMRNAGITPYNSNLHLLLGADTDSYTSPTLFWNWAKYINYGTSTTNYSPMTIRSAWYQAAHDAFHNVAFPSGTTVTFAVAGDSACHDDTVQTNATPTGSWFYDSQQVFP